MHNAYGITKDANGNHVPDTDGKFRIRDRDGNITRNKDGVIEEFDDLSKAEERLKEIYGEIGQENLARGTKARAVLRDNLDPTTIPSVGEPQAHHILGVAQFDTPLGKRLQSYGIELNGKDNGIWLPRVDYPGNKATLHGPPNATYTAEINRRLAPVQSREEALIILDQIKKELSDGTLRIGNR